MNISVVSPYIYSYFDPAYGPTPGGAQRQQFLISRQLDKRGHSISFIVGDFGQSHQSTINDITLIKGAPTDVSGPLSIGRAATRLLYAMRSANPDVFLVRGSPKLTAATYCCARILRKPLVFRLANDSDIDPEYLQSNYSAPVQRLYRRAIRGAAAVMTQTEQQKEALNLEFGVDSRVVTNAYDLPSKNGIIPHTERDGILWVGSADPNQKKPQRFLQLATALPDIRFNMIAKPIIGDDGYHSRLRSEAQDISNLEFIGGVPPDSIHEYYNQNKILVNTSDYEGFPNTFLEAWRYETPVLSHSFDLDGLLSSGEVGFLTGDLDTLIQKTQLLDQDTELRSRMGTAARHLVKQEFSLDTVTTEYESVFRRSVS